MDNWNWPLAAIYIYLTGVSHNFWFQLKKYFSLSFSFFSHSLVLPTSNQITLRDIKLCAVWKCQSCHVQHSSFIIFFSSHFIFVFCWLLLLLLGTLISQCIYIRNKKYIKHFIIWLLSDEYIWEIFIFFIFCPNG